MDRTERKWTGALLIAGAVIANAAFAGLGSVFHYPDILQQPAAEILRQFSAQQGVIGLWFLLLALGAGLIAPIAVFVSRLAGGRTRSWIRWTGIVAAAVQVVGLLRWPLVVPSLAARNDVETFAVLHTVLGTLLGETLGYLFTGVWTLLVVREVGRNLAGAWFSWLGSISAGLILLGVLVPLGVPGSDFANFIGYVLWSIWLIRFGVLLWRAGDPDPAPAAGDLVGG